MGSEGWIGVDLDGTLAHYDGWVGPTEFGKPIPLMVARVKAWLAVGLAVKIFTARVSDEVSEPGPITAAVQEWCETHIGQALPVTCVKDYGMVELWDDRAIQIIPNTGRRVDGREA